MTTPDTLFVPPPLAEAGGAHTELATRVAMQIIELVRRADMQEGAHLTEQWLAQELKVSRSPIRRAMAFLEELGVLSKEKNRGFFLKRAASTLGSTALSSDPDHDEALYMKIAEDRISGKLDDYFSEAEITRRYNLTLRQTQRVLNRMYREDLIQRRQGHGWEFMPLLDSAEAHAQSYQFRMVIEPAAILLPTYVVDLAEVRRQRKIQEDLLKGDLLRLSRAELFRSNAEMHEAIISFSGNQFLVDALRRQNRLRRLIGYRHNVERSRIVQQCQEHLRLLDLLEANKLTEAADFLRRHLDVVGTEKTAADKEAAARSGKSISSESNKAA
jgi:DNA-binding GntR family transcriptional regulator